MSALSVNPVFPIFTDIDGQPLEAGDIYIGVTGLDPITNPINVYWNAALTQLATQPIKTRGGYPLNGAAIGRLYVGSDYSIKAVSRAGNVVYSATAAGDRISSELVTFLQAGANAVTRTAQAKMRDVVSVKDFGAVGDGVADDTAAFAAARAVTNRYYIPSGTYALSASPDPFLDCFTADNGVTLVVGGTSYDCSNAFAGPLRYVAASAVKTEVRHAKTGNIIQYWQDGGAGTANGFFKGLAITTDSHFAQVQPATNGGSTDLLFQRSTLNADPGGNRFNITFEESSDRLLFSYATTAGGAPSFDSIWAVTAGIAPSLICPALMAQFNQGLSVKQRAAGGFEFKIEQSSSTQAKLIQVGGSATTYMTFRDAAFGFFGSTGTSQQTVTGSRGGNAALASLLTALANTGLIVDGTTP
jgi:hypothetical protein